MIRKKILAIGVMCMAMAFGFNYSNAQVIDDPFPKTKACIIVVVTPGAGAVRCSGDAKLCWSANDCSFLIEQ